MKRTFILLLFVISFFNCEFQQEEIWLKSNIGTIPNYNFENDIEISSIDEAILYVRENTKYVWDIDSYWQSPIETYYRTDKNGKMMGDCEDFAIFLSFLLDTKLGIKSLLVIIETIFSFSHAIIYVPEINRFIEPQQQKYPKNFIPDILEQMTYEEALWRAVFHKY